MYTHPFSAPYWQDASRELRDLRKLLFAALMIALCIVLAQVPSVPLFGGAKVTWGFLARSVCAWVCGPVLEGNAVGRLPPHQRGTPPRVVHTVTTPCKKIRRNRA